MKDRDRIRKFLTAMALTLALLPGRLCQGQEAAGPPMEPTLEQPSLFPGPPPGEAGWPEEPPSARGNGEDGLRLNFRGAPLDDVLDYLSKAAGFVIVREANITATVDVWSHQPLTKDEAVNLLNTILYEKGYAAIRRGRTLTIVDRKTAKERDLPVKTGSNPEEIPQTDEMVTHVIPVKYVDAVALVENLQPLLPTYSTMTANQSSNSLVITDTQANVRRLAEIIQALDTSISSISMVKVFQLQYTDATELADVIRQIFQSEDTTTSNRSNRRNRMERFFGGPPGMPGMPGMMGGSSDSDQGKNRALQAASTVTAVADERSNSLVVSAPEEVMPTIEKLIKEIDTVMEDLTEIRVFFLKYADAEELSQTITDIYESDSSTSSSSNRSGRSGRSGGSNRGIQRMFGGGPFGGGPFGGGPFGGGPGGPSGMMGQSSSGQSLRRVQETTVVAVADTRTNSVVVSAASGTMVQIAKMIKSLDMNPAKKKKVFTYSVRNADVDTVADILRGTFEVEGTSSSSSSRSNRSSTSNRSSSRQSGTGSSSSRGSSGGSSSGFGSGGSF